MTAPVTLQDMRQQLEQCIDLLRGIPQQQRTLAMKQLFNDLRLSLARYDDLKRAEEKP